LWEQLWCHRLHLIAISGSLSWSKLTMRQCRGANLMCAVTAVLETQQVGVTEPVTELAVDTASGTVKVCARVHGGRVTEITIESVLSFAAYIEHKLDVPEYGELVVDIGFGGQFYVQAPASAFGLEL